MCGIVLAQDQQVAEDMLRTIAHRGRDQRGLCNHQDLWIGTNRLKIVDVREDYAQQPLISAGSLLAFNGEIFNRDILYQAMLDDANCLKPKSRAEIQVLDTLIQRHKGNFQRFLDGYFGLIRIDLYHDEVMVSRDMLGVVPLYYQLKPDFRVASENKALGMACIEVQPGETITFWREQQSKRWQIKHKRRFEPVSLHMEAMDMEHLRYLFDRAVRRRIEHAEVPVCIALSGGLDSSLVVASAVTQGYANLHALTVCIDPESEEAQNAVKLCRYYGVRHDLVCVTRDEIKAEVGPILYALEDYTPNKIKYAAMVRNYFVAKHADATVILCGEGADELGCGYPSHKGLHGLQREWKSYSTLRSMHAINLDRVNKGGMAHTKEYRTPFLDRALVLYVMGCVKADNKNYFRTLAGFYGMPDYILAKGKYSAEEEVLWEIVSRWPPEQEEAGHFTDSGSFVDAR